MPNTNLSGSNLDKDDKTPGIELTWRLFLHMVIYSERIFSFKFFK